VISHTDRCGKRGHVARFCSVPSPLEPDPRTKRSREKTERRQRACLVQDASGEDEAWSDIAEREGGESDREWLPCKKEYVCFAGIDTMVCHCMGNGVRLAAILDSCASINLIQANAAWLMGVQGRENKQGSRGCWRKCNTQSKGDIHYFYREGCREARPRRSVIRETILIKEQQRLQDYVGRVLARGHVYTVLKQERLEQLVDKYPKLILDKDQRIDAIRVLPSSWEYLIKKETAHITVRSTPWTHNKYKSWKSW